MTGVAVLRRLVIFRRRQLGVLATLGFVLSFGVIAVAAVIGASSRAVHDGVVADHGGFAYAVQATGGTGTPALIDAQPGMHPVEDEPVSISRGDLLTDALSRRGHRTLALGTLTSGRWASGPDEVAVSRAVCHALNAQVGDRLELTDEHGVSRSVTVTGILVNAADLDDPVVVGVQPDLDSEDVTLWLTDRYPYDYQALVDPLDRRAVNMVSVASRSESRARDLPHATTSLRLVPGGLAILVGTLLVAAVVGFFPAAVLDVRSLMAAGWSARRAWGPVLAMTTVSVVLGELVGATTALLGVRAAREQMGDQFNQAWLSVPVPAGPIVATFAATVGFFLVIGPTVRGLSRVVTLSGRQPRAVAGAFWSRTVLLSWLLLVSCCIALVAAMRTELPDRLLWSVPFTVAVASVAIALAALSLIGVRLQQASRGLLKAMARSLAPVAAGVALLTSLVGYYVSMAVHDSYVAQTWDGTRQQAKGALYLSGLPGRASAEVRDQYGSLGGRHVERYLEPDESQVHSRVSTTGLLGCIKRGRYRSIDDMPVSCEPQVPTSSMNVVLLSPDPAGTVEADRYLVADSEVAILQFKTMSSLILKTATVSVRSSPALGVYLMPGMVVPFDGEVAREFGLVPSGTEFLALRDFASLPPLEQSRIRGTVARLAPSASVLDTTKGDVYGRQRSLARGVALAAAALAFLVMLVGGLASYLGSRRALDALRTLNAGRRYRLGLLARLFAAPTLALLAAPVLIAVGNRVLDGGEGASYGVAWLFPAAGGLAGLTVVILVWLRVPQSASE